MKNILVAFGLLFGSTAFAQETIDAHGFQLVPSDGDLHDGLSTWRAERHESQSVGVNALFEYASQPLTLHQRVDGVETTTDLVNSLTALNLGVFYAPHERVAITASSPLFLQVDDLNGTTGVGVGDLRLAGSVGVILPKPEGISPGLSVVPFLDVPGFYGSRSQLSLDGVAGGALAVASVGNETWDVSGNAGFQLTPDVDLYNLQGKEKFVGAASVAYSVADNVAVRGEWVFKPSLRDNKYNGTESPMEAIVSVRGFTGNHLGWTFGAAKALNHGVSAATWRAFAGIDVVFGARQDGCPECGPVKLWFSTEGPPPVMGITDGNIMIMVNSGDQITMGAPGEYLVKVITQPCEELVSIEGNQLILMKPILFDFDQDTIRFPDSQEIMTALAETLVAHPEITLLEVATGTDTRGSAEYNQNLSERRARSVVMFLTENGVDASRLISVGRGETQLREKNCLTEECHEKNRYSQFTILSTNP